MSLTRQREDAPRTRSADGRPGRGASRWHRRRRDIRSLVLRRIAVGVPMLVAVSAGVFILAANSPFNPLASYLGSRYQQATEAQKQSMSNELGFEDSWWHSWMTWVGDLVHGDLGWSRVYSMPVSEVFASRLGWTVLLSACGLILAVVAALIIGTTAGLRPGSVIDRACSALAVVLQSMPPFVVALTGVALFSVILRWAPPGGAAPPGGSYTVGTVMTHIVLPSCALAVSQAPWLLLSVRASVARAVVSDPVRSARARGLAPRTIVTRHVLPVSLAPLVTIIGARLPELIVGTVLVEEVFAWPGLAAAVVESAKALDFPLLSALTVATTGAVLLGSLLADIAYLILDPRVSSDV